MKERPILFNGSMVKAILEGRKTQTRRVVKSTLIIDQAEFECGNRPHVTRSEPNLQHYVDTDCPYGQIGDRLWVREAFMDLSGTGVEHRDSEGKLQKYAYAADCPKGSHGDESRKDFGLKWKPSIHMPRSASRILLEITKIRVERLNSISRIDAAKEGLHQLPATGRYVINKGDQYFGGASSNPIEVFSWLWEDISGSGSWGKNPWVWVVEFKVVSGGAG
ncbi:hypothetical protein [Acinetobacter sp.]|uniref:hypothetical protein n=1 Tax=Acinetobacter sp. TaxID=472 RepID=UPI0035ADB2FD